MEKNVKLVDIISQFKTEIQHVNGAVGNKVLKYLKPIDQVDEYTLDWVNPSNPNAQYFAEYSKAKVILCNDTIVYSDSIREQDKVLLICECPKLILSKIYNRYFKHTIEESISTKADISPDATIGQSCHIGAFCSIGKCIIGDNVVIMPNVTIYDDVKIGNNVIIHSGTTIGVNGLGCIRDNDDKLYVCPHIGGVVIEDNIDIGANTFIARGAFSNTRIGSGTKINAGCFIAHNCQIGVNVLFTGDAMIAGSSNIGDNSIIYSKVFIREQVTIGSRCIVGAGSVVTKNIPSNETWFGIPAKKHQ